MDTILGKPRPSSFAVFGLLSTPIAIARASVASGCTSNYNKVSHPNATPMLTTPDVPTSPASLKTLISAHILLTSEGQELERQLSVDSVLTTAQLVTSPHPTSTADQCLMEDRVLQLILQFLLQ